MELGPFGIEINLGWSITVKKESVSKPMGIIPFIWQDKDKANYIISYISKILLVCWFSLLRIVTS
jgi:hypothetical protein